MFRSTWNCPMFIPEHEVVESEEGLWIDGKEIKGVVKDSVKVEKHKEFSVITLSIVVKSYELSSHRLGRGSGL